MKSRRELLELVKTGVISNHKDYYVVHPKDLPTYTVSVRNNLRRYRVYRVRNDINIRSAVMCVDLREVQSNTYELGYKSNGKLLSAYGWTKFGVQVPYSTLNKKLRYR